MVGISLAERAEGTSVDNRGIGPFVTISRQYGCYGFSLWLLLLDVLNDSAEAYRPWRIYHREILERLAQTDLAADFIEQELQSDPGLVADIFRSLGPGKTPTNRYIRHRITTIIRSLATQGHAIIVGQGAAFATHDLPNGLWIRLEAPEAWRESAEVSIREGIDECEAWKRVQAKDAERERIGRLYERRWPRHPAYHLIYDCSYFSLANIARHIVTAMRFRELVPA